MGEGGPLAGLDEAARDLVEEAEQPEWTAPMLATLAEGRFSDPDWIYERKLDGVRLLVFRRDGDVRLLTRNRKDRNATWPELVDALEDGGPDLVADGEVVAFEGGVTSFSRLQERLHVETEVEARKRARSVAVKLYLFDLLHVDGHDITSVPLRSRKGMLRRTMTWSDPLRFTRHRNESGETYWEEACRKGWEGIIAKDARSPYVHDRSRKWLKFKCVAEQEMVVGGFTDPHGSRVGFGALLLGYHVDGGLRYAGKVGTGWSDDRLRKLRARLDGLERRTSPFQSGDPPDDDEVHWVTPELVAQVRFTEWTDDGRLRHPRFLGLRRDKDPRDVVRERSGEA